MTVLVASPSPIPPPLSDLATLHSVPISERPRKTWAQFANAVAFGTVFNLGCVLINVAQFALLLPLRVVPFGRRLYDGGIRRSKGAFGTLLGEIFVFQTDLPFFPLEAFERSDTAFGRCHPTNDIMASSVDVFVVRTYELGDHIRDRRTGQVQPGRVKDVG